MEKYSSVFFCESCRDWFSEHLPNMLHEDVARDMQMDEARAKEISEAIACEGDEAADDDDSEPTLSAYGHDEIGTWIQDEFDLLTYTDVVANTGKTPQQCKLKPMKTAEAAKQICPASLIKSP